MRSSSKRRSTRRRAARSTASSRFWACWAARTRSTPCAPRSCSAGSKGATTIACWGPKADGRPIDKDIDDARDHYMKEAKAVVDDVVDTAKRAAQAFTDAFNKKK